MNYEAIVETAVDCKCRVDKEVCPEENCSSCYIKTMMEECLVSLDPSDQLAIRNEVLRRYADIKYYDRKAKRKSNAFKFIITFIILIFLFCIGKCADAYARDAKNSEYYKNDEAIRKILLLTTQKVYDRDNDHEVNCIDYTLTFKEEWDKKYKYGWCEIIRNYNPRGLYRMNHLFVRVKLSKDGPWLYVEPQGKYYGNYSMQDVWKWKYVPYYNYYGETELWLLECVR